MIGFSPFSAFFCSASGQPPGDWPRSPRSIETTESGKAMSLRRVLDIGDGQVLADHHQRHVADDLGRRRHLDDVAEHQIDVVIGLRHLVPARLQPERARLLLEVGELAARHLVQIDFRGRPLQVALEGGVLVAHRLPVERDFADPLRVEAGVALGALQRLDDRAEAGLRGVAGEGVHRRVDGVDAGSRPPPARSPPTGRRCRACGNGSAGRSPRAAP